MHWCWYSSLVYFYRYPFVLAVEVESSIVSAAVSVAVVEPWSAAPVLIVHAYPKLAPEAVLATAVAGGQELVAYAHSALVNELLQSARERAALVIVLSWVGRPVVVPAILGASVLQVAASVSESANACVDHGVALVPETWNAFVAVVVGREREIVHARACCRTVPMTSISPSR